MIHDTHTHTHTHRVFKPCRNKMGIICMYSWKQCALAAITTMALWQFMHLGTWRTVSGYTMLYTVTHYLKHTYYTTLYYITLHLCYPPRFACWALLAHWYQECVTVHHMPKRRSCYKAIVVITMRTHCFHHCIITYVLRPSWFGRVWPLRALCVSWISNNNLYSYIYIYIYTYIYIYNWLMYICKTTRHWLFLRVAFCLSLKFRGFNIIFINIYINVTIYV